jgi:hypothetical protein
MAFNEDDIQIKVTLDTTAAVKSVDNLKASLDVIFKDYRKTFNDLTKVTKDFAKVQTNLAKVESKERVDLAKVEAGQRLANAKLTTDKLKALYKAETAAFTASEKTKQAEARRAAASRLVDAKKISLSIVQTQQETVRLRNERQGSQASPFGGTTSNQVDALTGSLGKAIGTIAKANAAFYLLKQSVSVLIGPIAELNRRTDELARAANELEGLRTGFETLQRSIGNLPQKSIEDLREATKGLISDTDLYQRANQAVLLNVPTDTFNEAAAAAVKLGRAMGVDAAFGLESLSIGLGRQSRLYLDNLGIVVSAQEAYQNFALEVGKTAEQLSDSEKRAAFFAEALGKIKETAEELPDLLDTVGISQEKLSVAQKNANQAFLEGFNASNDLIAAYEAQAEQVKISKDLNYAFGQVVGRASSDIKVFAIGFEALKNAGKLTTVAIAEFFNQLVLGESLFDTPIEKLTNKLEEQRTQLSQNIKTLEVLNLRLAAFERAGNAAFGNSIYGASIEELTERIRKQREEVAKLEQQLYNLNQISVKPTIDLDELRAARQEIESAFTGFSEQAAQEEGINAFPGLDATQAQALIDRIVSIRNEFSKTKDILSFNKALKGVEYEVSNLLATGKLEKLQEAFESATSQEEADQIRANIIAVTEAVREQGVATEEGAKALRVLFSRTARLYREQATEEKKARDKSARILDQRRRDLENFTRKLRGEFDVAIPPEFSQQLADLFNTENLGTEELIDAILEIRKQFLAAGGDVAALQKEILELKKLSDQGIEIKGTSTETKESVKQIQDTKNAISQANSEILGIIQDVANIIRGVLSTAIKAALGEITREDVAEVATSVGTLIGAGIGGFFGGFQGAAIGASIGQQIGGIVGDVLEAVTGRNIKDLAGTQSRKQIDKAFAELFAGDRLAVVISNQFTGAIDEATGELVRATQASLQRIDDLVFEGFTAFGGDVDYGSEGFFAFLRTLPAEAQDAFNGFGAAFGELIGVTGEQARMIGAAITNNIGGSLQNLQVFIQATGKSFEELSNALLQLFLDAQLSIEEYYKQALALQQLFETGIPDAIGAVDQALSNLQTSLADGRPGRYAVDSLRDVAAEGQEVNRTFQSVIQELAASYGATAQQTQLFFAALQAAGITSLEQLKTAGENTIISLLFAFQQIKDQAVTTAEEVGSIAIIPEIQAPEAPSSRGPSGPDPAEERRRALEALRQETYRLLIASRDYANILKQINSLELTNIQGGREIRQLREEIFKTLRRVNNLEEKYQKELDKGARASEKRLSRLGRALDEARKKLADLTETADESTDSTRQLDLSGIIPLIRDANKLSVVTQQAGVDLNKNIDILIKGFLQGRLSISEVNAEIEKTRELLGPGIPNAVGAVTDAFQNLIDAGEQGGAFSVDAFTDIFAEFREKFEKEGSALREAQRQQLVANLEQAKQAFAQAVGPEATAEARKSLDLAKKALSDFYDEIPAPDLEDLRSQLQSAFSPEQVDLFFRALDESGLKTFDDFEKAGADSVIGILGRLKELGFQFNETSDDIVGINDGLIDAEKNANGGLDPLAEAIELVKQFNEGASTLPPVFNSTTEAIGNMQGPLQQLSDGFDNIIEKLSLLSGQTFENNVVFNVRTVGDSNSQTLIDILFGDGGSTGGDVGGEGPGVGSDTRKLEKFRKELQKLKSSGRGKSRRADILRRRIRLLTGGGNSL